MSTKIFDAETSDVALSAIAASYSGSCVVHASGAFDGARVYLYAADSIDTAQYDPIDFVSKFTAPGWRHIALVGTGTIKAKIIDAGANTSITLTVNN